jgi:DNA-binding response OmpR family regulator
VRIVRLEIGTKDTWPGHVRAATVEAMSTTVLLTEREPAIRGLLEQQLRHDGFELAAPGSRSAPDLVLTGDEVEVERWRGQAPVIVLGPAEAAVDERLRAFRRGCDDYLARPFDYEELVERMRAVLRRAGSGRTRIVAGPLVIDRRARLVTLGGTRVELSQKEYELLLHLGSEPERVFTKEELLRDVWGFRARSRTRTLDAHASRLRRKLRAVDPGVELVENVWGVGYRLLATITQS